VRDDAIHTHVRAAGRPGAETDRLLAKLAGTSWPGGTADRSDPIARGWLRHFGAIVPIVVPAACTCRRGRCAACN
jgi:hypothetical protein